MSDELNITPCFSIPLKEIEMTAVRSSGAGGQNVNKVATAIHLRFPIKDSSLPDLYKNRLLALGDSRITKDGVIIIKAQQQRTQEKNRRLALQRLVALIQSVTITRKRRIATRPGKAAANRAKAAKDKQREKKRQRKNLRKYDY